LKKEETVTVDESANPKEVLSVINTLLGPDGCPWDRQQTPRSLCDYLVEEVFELVEAVRAGDVAEIEEELGDVFFLMFFVSALLDKEHGLSLDRVWRVNARKMIGRHPHVFGESEAGDIGEIHRQWERIKQEEKERKGKGSGPLAVLSAVPDSLPPLIKAYRLHAKAAELGFTWEGDEEQDADLASEWREWRQARQSGDHGDKEEELGDLLFSLVEQGRRSGIKANAALHRANRKFLQRVKRMIELAEERGMRWETLDMPTMDGLWREVKQEEPGGARQE
jgi:ATP diphosphatase